MTCILSPRDKLLPPSSTSPNLRILLSFTLRSDLTLQVTQTHPSNKKKQKTKTPNTPNNPVSSTLNTRIISLHNRISSSIRVPSRTSRVQRIIINQSHRVNNGRLFEELESEALECVPTDVAMHEPGARVVGLEGENEVAGGGKDGDVAAGWVGEVQGYGGGVVGPCAGGDDVDWGG